MTEEPNLDSLIGPQEKEKKRIKRIKHLSTITPELLAGGVQAMVDRFNRKSEEGGTSAECRQIFEDDIAELLRKRILSNEITAILKKISSTKKNSFNTVVSLLENALQDNLHLRGQKGSGVDYWQVSDPEAETVLFSESIQGPKGQRVGVQRKEYFTFIPIETDSNSLIVEVEKFYAALFKAVQRIKELSRQDGFTFTLKFKSTLSELLLDPNSVIVYVSNPEIGKKIRLIINEEMSNNKIEMGKDGYMNTGFDLNIGGNEISYRRLIAKAIAKKLLTINPRRSTISVRDRNAESITEDIIAYMNWAKGRTPEEMLGDVV